jgi:Asp-tRNA(Asn)/Glu-tRNA(Gln) amidotransferase A subunit family amidase
MALSWSMDKIGPITRSVEDCAIVLSAIYGPDGHDLCVKPAAFNWDAAYDWKHLRVGYIKSGFEAAAQPAGPAPTDPTELEAYNRRMERMKGQIARNAYDMKYAAAALDVIRTRMGVTLIPVELPKFPFGSVGAVLDVEAAAAFDSLTRSGRDKLLAAQGAGDWPNTFRVARFYSGVDYIQAMRARTLAIAEMDKLFQTVDIIVCTSQGQQSSATNLCGQPAVIVPNGVRGDDAPTSDQPDGGAQNAGGPGTPLSITFLGGLYSDARVAAFARSYQEITGFHKLHPKLA